MTSIRNATPSRGFALVVTVSVLVLLAVIAVGLLTLSTVTVRASTSGSAQAQAKANARLALVLAIGDLQKQLGPDRRISARASLIHPDSSNPNLVGAWESWQWNPENGGAPTYSDKKELFGAWLVSSRDTERKNDEDLPSTPLTDPVWLINPDTVGGTGPSLRAELIDLDANRSRPGGLAYAVMDESLKASINLPDLLPENSASEIALRTAPPRNNPETLIPELTPGIIGDYRRLTTLPTALIAAGSTQSSDILGRQDALTTGTLSLLTNVVDGGFKKDLTTAFESRGRVTQFFDTSTLYFSEDDGAPTWSYLRDHYQHYRSVRNAATGVPTFKPTSGDLRPGRRGTDATPDSERLMPVIAKLQIVFSIVTHFSHISDRVRFFDTKGTPKGNTNYGCPHLVYDPVVTLYNPYDVAIELDKLRIRIWDPPVLFGFKKNNQWLRSEHGSGELHGLARFQIANERNPGARKAFTLLLSELSGGGKPGSSIKLAPGEVRIFSPWVEDEWNWKLEAGTGYNPRAFFDFDQGKDFGNRDNRTNNALGVETIPGWDIRAGLQTDHLSYAGNRPAATRYPFERQDNVHGNAGWLGIKKTDTFSVAAKAGRAVAGSREADFKVDLLAGRNRDPERDYLRSYSFRFQNVEEELSKSGAPNLIERTFLVEDLLQEPDDPSSGGKSPFSILTMSAKSTIDPDDVSMPWLHNHMVTEGTEQDTTLIGNALDTYDLRFQEIQDFNAFPGIEYDSDSNRGFYGASVTRNGGVSNIPMFRVPIIPASSLGDLIPANLVASSQLPRVTHPLGNSHAHPLIPSGAVSKQSASSRTGQMLDHSYLINDALWDKTFFSTIGSFTGGLVPNTTRSQLLDSFLQGDTQLINSRLVPLASTAGQASRLDSLSDPELSRQIAGALAINGGFNVNSDSVEAWRTILSSLRGQAVRGWGMKEHSSTNKTSFPRASLPLAGDSETVNDASIDVQGQIRWAGFRALDEDQIESLAIAIVKQLRERGTKDKTPNLSLSEFVNRRIGQAGDLHALSGILETAIEESGINADSHDTDSRRITGNEDLPDAALTGLAEPAAREGMTGAGAPSILTQGDLLMPLASVITVRGDTFRIRAYGEARDGSGATEARAWCEATVQRVPEFVDSIDAPELEETDLNVINKRFGRRFVVTTFRWLSAEEI